MASRRLSLTLFCPMNSASRCGLSDSSTTLSSERTSGVVISARDMALTTSAGGFVIPNIARNSAGGQGSSDRRSHRGQPVRRPLQRLVLLAEGEADERLPERTIGVEARPRHRGDA